jgi:hypothetical protein
MKLNVLFMCVLWSGAAIAGLFKDSVTYDIRVVDEQERPVPAATVWVLGPTLGREDLRPADLSRLVRRYSADADFVFSGQLHGQLWVLHAGPQGTIRFSQEDTEVHGLKRVQTSFAGLKRGFIATQVDDEAPNNSRRKIELKLRRDATAEADPRMEELDAIRALAIPGDDAEDPMSGNRDRRLQDAGRSLRELAMQLEKDGRADDAAAAYYNLAFLPSVDVGRNQAGELVVIGYTNGYDASSPQRVADRLHALKLSRSHPMLEFQALDESYRERKVFNLSIAANAPVRHAYLADAEALIARHGERTWPQDYSALEEMYTSEKKFAQGCEALRRWHEFEPSYFDAKGWTKLLGMYFAGVQMEGGPADIRCDIPGVPAPAGH